MVISTGHLNGYIKRSSQPDREWYTLQTVAQQPNPWQIIYHVKNIHRTLDNIVMTIGDQIVVVVGATIMLSIIFIACCYINNNICNTPSQEESEENPMHNRDVCEI